MKAGPSRASVRSLPSNCPKFAGTDVLFLPPLQRVCCIKKSSRASRLSGPVKIASSLATSAGKISSQLSVRSLFSRRLPRGRDVLIAALSHSRRTCSSAARREG